MDFLPQMTNFLRFQFMPTQELNILNCNGSVIPIHTLFQSILFHQIADEILVVGFLLGKEKQKSES